MIQKAKNYYQTKKDRVSIIEKFLKMRKKKRRKLRNYAKNKTKNMSDGDREKKLS